MQSFLSLIKPSLQYKVIKDVFGRILKQTTHFKKNEQEMDFLLNKIQIVFYQPQQEIIRQYD